MIQLIISFLISLGWVIPSDKNSASVSITETSENRYGVVVIDEIQQRTATLIYESATGTFSVE